MMILKPPNHSEESSSPTDYRNPAHEAIDACFAPETNFVFGGSFSGTIPVWSLKTSFKVCTLNSAYEGPCYLVAFNPVFMNLATAGTAVHLWNEKY